MSCLKRWLAVALFALCGVLCGWSTEHPKREFRGVWLPTAWQTRFVERDCDANRAALRSLLDRLSAVGVNVVIFQVRPQADAFYDSQLELWSRHLTGQAGVAPDPYWDPLAFMIEECHARNMELHAWINPYRVTLSESERLPSNHLYYKEPDLFVRYGGRIYFDPGNPRAQEYILKVIRDLAARYDIDGLHMDDYFYPYPAGGEVFDDDATYARYGGSMNRSDWRRANVNALVSSVHGVLADLKKPWVSFGISPFGIYRNRSSWQGGSATNGLQAYDDLYADVLRWAAEGWIDYVIPQLYWTVQHSKASYDELARWWNRQDLGDCHLYIGQDVAKSYDAPDLAVGSHQLKRKIELSRYLDRIQGDCFWYGYQFADRYAAAGALLSRDFYSIPALLPAYSHLDGKAPDEVASVKVNRTVYGRMLEWKPRRTRDAKQQQVAFAVYRFRQDEAVDLTRGDALVAVTRNTAYLLPYRDGSHRYVYVVTAIDRFHNESAKGRSVQVSL